MAGSLNTKHAITINIQKSTTRVFPQKKKGHVMLLKTIMKKLMIVTAISFAATFITSGESFAKPKNKAYHYSYQKAKVKKSKKTKYAYKRQAKKEVANVVCSFDRHSVSSESQNCHSSISHNTLAKATVSTVRSFGGGLSSRAEQYVGKTAGQLGLPKSLWCADFMNMLVGGTDRRAISYARRGTPARHGCVDCVAVLPRRGGNHVGVVSGYDSAGNPIIISGNHNRQVGVGVYSKHRVIAYRHI
jgi:uncharacterized protein (TIGR02594 family)